MKHVIKKRAAIMALLMLSLMLSTFAFGATASAASVKLNKKSVTLAVATSTTLKVTGTKAKVTWSSSKKSVATVNSKGKVTAKKKGTTTITAKVGKKKLTCKVKVVSNVKNIYTKEQLGTTATWKKIRTINDTNFCNAVYKASYDSKGQLTLLVAAANLNPYQNWKMNVMSVRVTDKKGNLIATGSFNMKGTNMLKPGEWNSWKVPLKGTKTKKVIDLRKTAFRYQIVIN